MHLLDRVPSTQKSSIQGDILSAWEAINNGVVEDNNKTREKYWKHWRDYTKAFGVDPYLSSCPNVQQIIIITAFAARVRTGHYGKGNIVRVPTVTKALAAISKTIELAGEPSPLYKAEKTYKTPVARLIEGFRREDPPATPQLALPIKVPQECQNAGLKSHHPFKMAVGDLAIIAFYYLLRVGEYTKPRVYTKDGQVKRATRTVQFSVGNVGFFKNNKILPRRCKLQTLLQADSCTLKITNQKNGRMGETIHQYAIKTPNCPVKALARRVHHILSNKGTTDNLLCDVYDKFNNRWLQVTPHHMIQGIRTAVATLKLESAGINPDLVGVHSLRAGGAMSLKLQGETDTTIMKMGRWTSLTFLQYIHNQIAHLSKDISTKMSQDLHFQNISAIEKAD